MRRYANPRLGSSRFLPVLAGLLAILIQFAGPAGHLLGPASAPQRGVALTSEILSAPATDQGSSHRHDPSQCPFCKSLFSPLAMSLHSRAALPASDKGGALGRLGSERFPRTADFVLSSPRAPPVLS